MSVGHVARIFEEQGIATVVVQIDAFRSTATQMGLPRVVTTRHPMGRPLGPPGDEKTQLAVLRAAFGLVEQAEGPRAMVRLPAPYRPLRR